MNEVLSTKSLQIACSKGSVQDGWDALVSTVAQVGVDTVSYALVQGRPSEGVDGVVHSLTTMPDDWQEEYDARRLAQNDEAAAYVHRGGSQPMLCDVAEAARSSSTAASIYDAGVQGCLIIPLRPATPFTPVAGVVLGTRDTARAGLRTLEHAAPALLGAVEMFHSAMGRHVVREQRGYQPLSPRQRDCLQGIARGERIDALAYRLDLSNSTVALHIRSAKQRLKARSLPEAVARALVLGEIEPE